MCRTKRRDAAVTAMHRHQRQLTGILTLLLASLAWTGAGDIHLFILSGQSNMAGLKPQVSFDPDVRKALPGDEVIVVKDAASGQPIRRWFKEWKPEGGEVPEKTGDLYDRMMGKVKEAVGDKKPATVTFVWMQGERDAKERRGSVYAASLAGVIAQLRKDLNREDVNAVIGRLSDFGKYPDWEKVREAQLEVAKNDPRVDWVDTDDLNGPKNGLHYNKEGYTELGSRFAAKALELIGKPSGPTGVK